MVDGVRLSMLIQYYKLKTSTGVLKAFNKDPQRKHVTEAVK